MLTRLSEMVTQNQLINGQKRAKSYDLHCKFMFVYVLPERLFGIFMSRLLQHFGYFRKAISVSYYCRLPFAQTIIKKIKHQTRICSKLRRKTLIEDYFNGFKILLIELSES